ncbi:MAG TPA: hypothetical protein PKY77_08510 [Phycisphaerae bacterium]|nr:hypothetical protein [Phycisphaerae bacterium]HRY68735.1 hypothetical protein [Phycisphaerae bacterium]HSA29552.1 hypothetical protein [Phycisphaerae bacterium]
MLGWKPEVSVAGLVEMMVDADRELARRERVLADHGMLGGHSGMPRSR